MTIVDSRVPVITNADEFSIPWQTLQTIIAGRSLIDTPELQIANLDEVIPVIPGTVYLFAGWLDLSPDGRGSACIGKARRSFPVSWWGGLTVI